LNIYSFKFFLKLNFIEIIYYLIQDENNVISASIVEKILFFHKKIKYCSKESFDKICSILSEINIISKDGSSVKHFDIEKNRTIKKLLKLNDIYTKQNNMKNRNVFNFGQENDEKEENEIKSKEAKKIAKESEILGKAYQTISLLITVNSSRSASSTNNIILEKKNEIIENKTDKINNFNEESVQTNNNNVKDKINKKKLLTEKSISGVLQNINTRSSSKKFLPKIRYNLRKNSCKNSRPYETNNFFNNNNSSNIEKIGIKTLNINKIIIGIKDKVDKTPEKKNHLKSINRIPSANSSKNRDSYSVNSKLNKANYLYNSHNKFENNLYFDELNYQIININDINKSSIFNHMIGFTGKEIFKDITPNENINNHINKDLTYAHSTKLVTNFYKNGSKSVKKKETYFNVSNKITINAKGNENNKSNK
jgi:hypothetical protein